MYEDVACSGEGGEIWDVAEFSKQFWPMCRIHQGVLSWKPHPHEWVLLKKRALCLFTSASLSWCRRTSCMDCAPWEFASEFSILSTRMSWQTATLGIGTAILLSVDLCGFLQLLFELGKKSACCGINWKRPLWVRISFPPLWSPWEIQKSAWWFISSGYASFYHFAECSDPFLLIAP